MSIRLPLAMLSQSNLFFITLTTGFFLLFQLNINAQTKEDIRIAGKYNSGHEADRWFFGDSAGLDFRGKVPVADLSGKNWMTTSPTIISDNEGNFLFYSNGKSVYNHRFENMPNGYGLHGSWVITMPCLIAPKPDSENLYYLFTIGRPTSTPSDTVIKYGLEYSIVDMEMDTGMGAVVEKNIVLTEPEVSSKLTGVKHSNGTDYWIVVHMFDSDEFRAFLLTAEGINPDNYVSSHTGSFHLPPGMTNNGVGYMKLSPDGTKLALNIYGSGVIEIFDFNSSTGQVTNATTSPPVFREAYGLEFSPDSRFFYVSAISVNLPTPVYTPPSYLFQFDIAKGAEVFTEGNYDTVAQDTSGSYFGGMQIGKDGRIYITRGPGGNTMVSVFQNPVRQGEACNFSLDTVSLGGRTSGYGFPNFITSYFLLSHFELDPEGSTQTVAFQLRNRNNVDSILWNFGDQASNQNISRDFQPIHTFSEPGTYEVSVTEFFEGISYGPYIEHVTVNMSGIPIPKGPEVQSGEIYPQPALDRITLVLPDHQDGRPMEVIIYSISGQILTRKMITPLKHAIDLDVSGLPSAVYLLVCKAHDNVIMSRKFIVAR